MKGLSNRLVPILGFLQRSAYPDVDLIFNAIDCFGLIVLDSLRVVSLDSFQRDH